MTAPDEEVSPQPETEAQPRRLVFARLAAAVRRQDWFMVALEIAIVVIGVVIGFQVTSWGQERDLRDREDAQRAALREDFVANRQQLTDVLADLEVAVARQREMLRVVHGHSPRPSQDSLDGWCSRRSRSVGSSR